MTNILAIDTSTDACSVGLHLDGVTSGLFELAPRRHNQLLFSMLRELLPHGNLREQGIDAIAYCNGPGSFTGLRIAASAVQGLAYANDLPVIAVSTLACQVQSALRSASVDEGSTVLSMLDARINEVYWALFDFKNSLPNALSEPVVCAPHEVKFEPPVTPLQGVGGGFSYLDELPSAVMSSLTSSAVDIRPSAVDLIPLAIDSYKRGELQRAQSVLPVYVREEISWKKISEQGKSQ